MTGAGGRRPRTPRILLGVTGGIAAYKALDLVRRFRKSGWEVQVVMTTAARKLVGHESFAGLSGRPVAHELFPRRRPEGRPARIEHIDLAQWADLVLVAPATANILGKLAAGIADDLLSTLLLAVPSDTVRAGRVVFAPAMNTRMWEHASVRRNIDTLTTQGYVIVEPEPGELACGDRGAGRLADATDLLATCRAALRDEARLPDLSGIRVLVTAGRTEEPLDPVRVLTNRSSGRMGIALARAFRLARADVQLITGPLSVPLPAGIPVEPVRTSDEMRKAVLRHAPDATVLVMCAAVADYRPARKSRAKRRGDHVILELVKAPDILKAVSETSRPPVVIGFSHDPSLAVARRKLRDKKVDLIVANPYATADADTVTAVLVPARGRSRRLPELTKEEFGRRLVIETARLLALRTG